MGTLEDATDIDGSEAWTLGITALLAREVVLVFRRAVITSEDAAKLV